MKVKDIRDELKVSLSDANKRLAAAQAVVDSIKAEKQGIQADLDDLNTYLTSKGIS